MTRNALIASTGRYIPERCITNLELERQMGETFDQWLKDNVGIEQRHVMADDEVTSDLAVHAGRQALERAGLAPKDLDLIIVATDTPDHMSPATASVVQHKMGASCPAFDLNCACAGWVTALDMGAKTLLADDTYQHVLVVGAYGMTRFVDWTDKKTATLFADGAGAVVLSADDTADEKTGFLGCILDADGQYHDALGIYTGGTARPATSDVVAEFGKPRVEFVRRFPATFNTERWPRIIRSLLDRRNLKPDDVGMYVFTQLNLRTIEATMELLDVDMRKTHCTMDKWGYTGSACIPTTLDDAVTQGKVNDGDYVVVCATGGGLSLGASLWKWDAGMLRHTDDGSAA